MSVGANSIIDELDKPAMGKRIRQIRLRADLRQWELARLLGTTQSAIHKYEHGVVPEPRRLIKLAQIGRTSIEWVLTGRHWENGSEAQQRLSPELLDAAYVLREFSEGERATLDEALGIVREAVGALEQIREESGPAESLRGHGRETLRLLESASRIQRAVLSRVAQETEKRLGRAAKLSGNGRGGPAERKKGAN
jgi:transcriptional regulator with XRE-family HTH domain